MLKKHGLLANLMHSRLWNVLIETKTNKKLNLGLFHIIVFRNDITVERFELMFIHCKLKARIGEYSYLLACSILVIKRSVLGNRG